MHNYLRLLQLRRGYFAPDTGAQGGAQTPPDGAGTATGGAQGAGDKSPSGDTGEGEKPAQGATEPKTFTQADIDRIIAKETAKWKSQQEKAIEAARTEAEKLATMTAEQRAKFEAKQREENLAKREQEITRRELKAQALETLAQKGLPSDLASMLAYTDADACNASIDAVEKAFRSAVQKGVEERLKGAAPKTGAGAAKADYAKLAAEAISNGEFTAAAYYTRQAGTQK